MSTFCKRLAAFRNRRVFRGIAVAVVFAIVAASFTGITYAANVVYIHDDEDVLKYYTNDSSLTAQEILKNQGVAFRSEDEIEFIGFENGEATLILHRAFPVNISADGMTTRLMVTGGTVGDALEKAGVTLAEDDLMNVSPYEDAVSGMQIKINRVTYETVTEESVIPFEVETRETNTINKGKTVVTQVGKEGVQVATFKKTIVDGEVTETELISTEVVAEPVTQKQTVGTSEKHIVSEILPPEGFELDANGVPTSYTKVLTGKATAYSSSIPNVRGASGKHLQVGSVAVNPNLIPYGSRLYITSADGRYIYGYAIAADTGTALMDGRVLVDCFFGSYAESCRFGAKTVNVYVLP